MKHDGGVDGRFITRCKFSLIGDVTPFLEKHDEIAPTTRRKLLELLYDGKKAAFLKMELASVVDTGEPFVKSTHILEGDGSLFFKCYDQIQILKAGIDNAHYPNVNAIAERLSTRGHTSQQWKQYVRLLQVEILW